MSKYLGTVRISIELFMLVEAPGTREALDAVPPDDELLDAIIDSPEMVRIVPRNRPRTFLRVDLQRACRVCGCTDDHACPEGCAWAEEDLCTACVEKGATV